MRARRESLKQMMLQIAGYSRRRIARRAASRRSAIGVAVVWLARTVLAVHEIVKPRFLHMKAPKRLSWDRKTDRRSKMTGRKLARAQAAGFRSRGRGPASGFAIGDHAAGRGGGPAVHRRSGRAAVCRRSSRSRSRRRSTARAAWTRICQMPDLGPNSPFREFFDDFFKKRQQGEGGRRCRVAMSIRWAPASSSMPRHRSSPTTT